MNIDIDLPRDLSDECKEELSNLFHDQILNRERRLRLLESNLVPHDNIVFKDHYFMFTEPFNFGSRKKCAAAVIDRGGIFMDKKRPTTDLQYLVLGEKNADWMDGELVGKIEKGLEVIQSGFPLRLITESEFKQALDATPISQEKGFITHRTAGAVRTIVYQKKLPEPVGQKCNPTHIEYLQGYIDSAWAWRKVKIEVPFNFHDLTTNQANAVAKDLRLIRRNPALFSNE
jgi:hypothetical protein